MQQLWESIKGYFNDAAGNVALKVIGAVVLLIVGFIVIRWIRKLMEKGAKRSKLEKGVRGFINSFVNIALKVLLIFAAAIYVGVPASSLVAILGSAGLAVGLALQGSLSNFAGGVMILLFKPFRAGDYIESKSGYSGTVEDINIFYTHVITPDNKSVTLPNGELSNNPITNYTALGMRRVDISVSVAYAADMERVRAVLLKTVAACQKVQQEPAPFARVDKLGDNSVDFALRAWCKSEDYWDVYYDLTEGAKLALDAAGIEIPFPQLSVHME